jgi:membrane protease YdiL (CAAX protease family)
MGTIEPQRSRLARCLHTLLPLGACAAGSFLMPILAMGLVGELPDDLESDDFHAAVYSTMARMVFGNELVLLGVVAVGYFVTFQVLGPRTPRPKYRLARSDFLLLVLAGLAVGAALQILSAGVRGRAPLANITLSPFEDAPLQTAAWLLLVMVVIGPAIEEICFRGYAQGELQRFWGPVVAIGLSSLAFVAMHRSVERIPSLMFGSIILGTFAWISGSIATSIILHASWNSLFFLVPALHVPETDAEGWTMTLGLLALGTPALVVSLNRMTRWRRWVPVATPPPAKP